MKVGDIIRRDQGWADSQGKTASGSKRVLGLGENHKGEKLVFLSEECTRGNHGLAHYDGEVLVLNGHDKFGTVVLDKFCIKTHYSPTPEDMEYTEIEEKREDTKSMNEHFRKYGVE